MFNNIKRNAAKFGKYLAAVFTGTTVVHHFVPPYLIAAGVSPAALPLATFIFTIVWVWGACVVVKWTYDFLITSSLTGQFARS